MPLCNQGTPIWRHVRCHDWKGDAIDEGNLVASWLSTFLQQRVRLVKYGGTLLHVDLTAKPYVFEGMQPHCQVLPRLMLGLLAVCKQEIKHIRVQKRRLVTLQWTKGRQLQVQSTWLYTMPRPKLLHEVLPMRYRNTPDLAYCPDSLDCAG